MLKMVPYNGPHIHQISIRVISIFAGYMKDLLYKKKSEVLISFKYAIIYT